MKNNRNVLVVLFVLVVTSACSSKTRLRGEPPAPPEGSLAEVVHDKVVEGPLLALVKKIQANPNFDEGCDIEAKDMQLEMAQALDSKSAEIEKYAKELPQKESSYYKKVAMGKILVMEVANPRTPKKGWNLDEEGASWADSYSHYQQIKDQPVNKFWLRLNSDVRSLVTNDRSRILQGANLFLNYASLKFLEPLKTAINECVVESSCTRPVLSPELTSFVGSVPYYRFYLRKLDSEDESLDKRALVKRFHNRVSYDVMDNGFKLNSSIKRTSANEISLPLFTSDFEDSREQLQKYIEDVWKNENIFIKINWVESAIEGVFKLLLGNGFGQRSYVVPSAKIVSLFSGVRSKSIAHEIGHVIGFSDHYYTLWNYETCEYKNEYNEEDLMSVSDTGTVLPDEWEQINNSYRYNSL